MKIVTVIPLKKASNKGDLTYFSALDMERGSIVSVPLRNKKILGLVIAVEDLRGAKSDVKEMNFNLKKVLEVKEQSIWRTEYLESILEISKYFVTSKNNAMATFIPSIFQEQYDKVAQFIENNKQGNKNDLVKRNIRAEKLILQTPPEDRISSYKTLIRESFAQKKSVFIVLPTERDIKNLHELLSKGIEQFTFAVHGGLSKKKVIDKFEKILTTDHGILILGTAPFLSIPRYDIGVVIVEHESSSSYKTIPKPHFDLRIFVELFASKINAKLILSDTLLRFETIGRREIDNLIPMHPLSFRINFEGVIEIQNPHNPKNNGEVKFFISKPPTFKIFSDKNIEEIKNKVSKKKNVFIFSLRKGLATMTVCRDCGEIVSCENCETPLVLHYSEGGKKRIFVCNRCQKIGSGDTVCRACKSWNLIPLGIGTDTVSEEIKKSLPGTKIKVLKLDKESAGGATGAEKIVKEFESNPGSILVGTEMALFYLNNEVPLSIIASFDSLWNIPNFKMSEKIIQLIISIIRITRDRLIIQTKNERDPAILAVESGNLLSFIREELLDRKNLNYPPYKRFIKITHLGNKEETLKARELLAENLKEYEPEIFSGFVAKLKGRYTTNALIKVAPRTWSLPEISIDGEIDENLFAKLSSLPKNFEVFVDPEDLL